VVVTCQFGPGDLLVSEASGLGRPTARCSSIFWQGAGCFTPRRSARKWRLKSRLRPLKDATWRVRRALNVEPASAGFEWPCVCRRQWKRIHARIQFVADPADDCRRIRPSCREQPVSSLRRAQDMRLHADRIGPNRVGLMGSCKCLPMGSSLSSRKNSFPRTRTRHSS